MTGWVSPCSEVAEYFGAVVYGQADYQNSAADAVVDICYNKGFHGIGTAEVSAGMIHVWETAYFARSGLETETFDVWVMRGVYAIADLVMVIDYAAWEIVVFAIVSWERVTDADKVTVCSACSENHTRDLQS